MRTLIWSFAACLPSVITWVATSPGSFASRIACAFSLAAIVAILIHPMRERWPVQSLVCLCLVAGGVWALRDVIASRALPFAGGLGSKSHPEIWMLHSILSGIIVIVCSRRAAKNLLRRCRTSPHFGLWLVLLALPLAFSLDAALSMVTRGDFLNRDSLSSPGASFWQSAAFRIFTVFLALVATFPWWIKTRPIREMPDPQALSIWFVLHLWALTLHVAP